MTDLEALFAGAGVTAAFHAIDIDTGREVAHHADEPAVAASVFKLPVLLELCRQAAAGEIDPSAVVTVPVEQRAPGPYGLSVMQDPASMSLRDLAWLMMGISDNAATDVICSRVELDMVAATLHRLGLTRTRIDGDCRDLFRTVEQDLGIDSIEQLAPSWGLLDDLRATDPERTLHVTTPRDMTRLLTLIWIDQAAPAEACAEARRILGLQVWPHRLAAGFADLDDVRTSGKTGTLPRIRNEAGTVEYADGGRYAVAVFTRSSTPRIKDPAADAVIGRSARAAVDALRST